MIRIAVVDDEKEILNIILKCIRSTDKLADEIQVDLFTEAKLFLEKAERVQYDILFSDIEMPMLNGIEFGVIVKERLPHILIIYLTAYEKYAVKSYLVKAYQYILKSDMDDRLPIVLHEAVEQICKDRKEYRIIKINNDFRKIFYKDIVYFKKRKSAKYVEFHTAEGELRERTTLEKVIREMNGKEFVVVERGYVVNIKHINRMNGNTIYMDNGEEVVISRARFSDVRDKIHAFFGGE